MMLIDEAISKYKEITNTDAICPAHCNIPCDKCVQESEQLVEWLEELKQLRKQTKTGHWIDYSEEGFVKCSECGSATNCDGNINELHFCFSCGAKMDERTLKYADQDTMMPAT